MTVDACSDCLRRTGLIADLAGRIDLEWRSTRARGRLLALSDGELLDWGADAAVRRRYAAFDAMAAGSRMQAAGMAAVCRCRPGYPASLLSLVDPPALLHVLGDRAHLATDAVAIVGARRATAYGSEVARSLGRALGASGLVVVSGMALGIDSLAHAGALDGGGTTVAVLGCGADRCYPAGKFSLYRRIRATGCVVSELPPGFPPYRWTFPARNRIIAGLARCTVVVEAAERSGSLITADFAAELGRPVGAVPGPVTARFSSGTNLLLKTGAELIASAQDILDLVFGAGAVRAADPAVTELPAELARLLARVRRGRRTVADLTGADGDPGAIAAGLSELEVRGLVRRSFDGRYEPALTR